MQRYRSGHNGADSKSVCGQPHEGSNPSRCASSSQASYRLRRAFSFHCKAHRALILLLLASNRDPLRWARGWVPLCGRHFSLLRNIDFNRLFHVGAKRTLLRRLFMPVAKKTSSARSLAPPFQIEPAPLGFDLVLGRNLEALASILLRYFKSVFCKEYGLSFFLRAS